ncbi:MAG: hypothetical protein JOY91_06175 [Sinobacteraceae bacterium]|nr:hypothetical protein [Nevskiaceae bacterium]
MQKSSVERRPISAAEAGLTALVASKRLRWFFFVLACLMMVVIAIAFAPTFYLRGLLRSHVIEAGLTPYIVLHGIVLTSWFVLFLAQAWMVATNRARLHRSLGVLGAALATAVLVLSIIVLLHVPARDAAIGATTAQIALEVVGDLGLLVLFTGLVTAAILNRHRPDVHKRLMALASVSLLAPALARWTGAAAGMPLSAIVPQFAFIAALMIYDKVTWRRVHPATYWGIASYIVVVSVSVGLALSESGRRIVRSLT